MRFIGIQYKTVKVINENSIITEVPIHTVKKYYRSTNRCITAKKPLLTKKYGLKMKTVNKSTFLE